VPSREKNFGGQERFEAGGMGVRRNFSRGETTSTFFLSCSCCGRCNVNARSQNALPFLHRNEKSRVHGRRKGGQGSLAPLDFKTISKKGCFFQFRGVETKFHHFWPPPRKSNLSPRARSNLSPNYIMNMGFIYPLTAF